MSTKESQEIFEEGNSQEKEEFIEQLSKKIRNIFKEEVSPPKIDKNELRNVFDSFLKKDNFKVGDLVKWKDFLRNRSQPDYDEPAVVVSVLDEAHITNNQDSLSSDFLEPLDIALGFFDIDGQFVIYYFDKRRFTHF